MKTKNDITFTSFAKASLRRWALEGYYVYIRPCPASYIEGARGDLGWVVQVERMDHGNLVGAYRLEGTDISEVIGGIDMQMRKSARTYRKRTGRS